MLRVLSVLLFFAITMADMSFAQSTTSNVSLAVSGGGTLSFTDTEVSGQCGRRVLTPNGVLGFPTQVSTLSNFSYTDPQGNVSGIPFGTIERVQSPPNAIGCPKPVSFPSSVEVALTRNIADFGKALTFIPKSSASISALDVGTLNPKFQVLAVVYAPPGAASNVSYGTSTMLGVNNSISNTFTNTNTVSDSLSLMNVGIPGILGGSVSQTESMTFTESSGSSHSIALSKSSSTVDQISGPVNSLAGVNHDFDQIFIWLNPTIQIAHLNNNVIIGQGGFDPTDPTGEMDVIPLFVIDLKNLVNGTFTGDPDIPLRLSRTWAGSNGGLTTADLNTILARDPFANGATTIDATRFTLTGQNFNYLPPPAGGQPDKTTLMLNYVQTTMQGQTATDTYSVGTTTTVSTTFLGFLTNSMTNSNTLTWTSTFNTQNTQSTGQVSTLNLTGPPAGYTGPTNLQVFQDNIYGTFMFNLIP
ncbi:MAG TPA: hypothetical protein VKZ53_02705 [Candidatus Angelobacter sp.]|nr:hypothetical protein [Candidatus Angelobacter sp.]